MQASNRVLFAKSKHQLRPVVRLLDHLPWQLALP